MSSRVRIPSVLATVALLAALPTASAATQSGNSRLSVMARHLDQPKKLTVAADGDVIVTLSGDGKSPASCTDSAQTSCKDSSGAVDEITPTGKVSTLLRDLTSISSAHDDPQATGPVEARLTGHRLQVLFQDLDLNASSGVSSFGTSSWLGDLVSVSLSASHSIRIKAALGPYEAEHEPDGRVLGSAVKYGYEGAINSDPYSFVPYRHGWAVADAGANDVLWISPHGAIHVLAVLPTIREYAKADTYGATQKHAIEAAAQAVPTAIAVGSDGALYVGELGGAPFATGSEDIYRIVPGHSAKVWATGFTSIGDIAFDDGRLLVLELDRKGIADPGLQRGKPASGELIAVDARSTRAGLRAEARTTLLQSGLSMPTGLAVAAGGTVYLSNYGTTAGAGEILRYAPSWVS